MPQWRGRSSFGVCVPWLRQATKGDGLSCISRLGLHLVQQSVQALEGTLPKAGQVHFHREYILRDGGIQTRLIFVQRTQPVSHVLKTQPVTARGRNFPIEFVLYADSQPTIQAMGLQPNASSIHQSRDAMLDGVFAQQLPEYGASFACC